MTLFWSYLDFVLYYEPEKMEPMKEELRWNMYKLSNKMGDQDRRKTGGILEKTVSSRRYIVKW